jgi:hypothetical protein
VKHLALTFDGIAPSTACSIFGLDLNPFDEGGIFGSGDDEKAKKYGKDAIKGWENLEGQLPDLSLSYNADPGVAADIHGYQYGPGLNLQGIDYVDPGKSSWDGASSAYDGLSSAWDDYAPDQTGRKQQLDASGYFRRAMDGGMDAQAEADYARRSASADQQRRSQSEAALSQLEQRGQGGGSEGLLAELVNNQGAAANKYQASLDAAAMGQARRDNAAAQYAAFGGQMYGQDLDSAARQAQGRDAFGTTRAAGQDAFATNKNNATDLWDTGVRNYGLDIAKYNRDAANAAEKANTERIWGVDDRNTDLQNQVGQYKAVGQPQAELQNKLAVQGGKTGAYGGAAQIYMGTAIHPVQDIYAPTASNILQSQATPGK